MAKERTLLLVDDDEQIGTALNRLLRQEGYHILCARSGEEGLLLLAKNEVHVIVSDQRMPGMTGVEFLSRAKELSPNTVRIILSGFADLSAVTDAVNHGAIYKFLTKPWDNEILCANVLEAFRHYELTQQKNHLALEIQEANTTLASLSLELSKLLAQKESQIEHISNYDHLTNLPDRGLFFIRLHQILKQARVSKRSVAILFIDLDHFNVINDSFGYEAGDELLQIVATKLANIVGDKNTLARIGSDEFGLLLAEINSSNDAGEIAGEILNSFSLNPVSICNNDIFVDLSIGISIYPADGADENTLIKNANSALREAKNKGKCYIVHSSNN
jgi:diguanylate cyclase (GGDEF)-like protein